MKNPLCSAKLPSILCSFVVIIAIIEVLFLGYLALERADMLHILAGYDRKMVEIWRILVSKGGI
jgi:hypothetical protein